MLLKDAPKLVVPSTTKDSLKMDINTIASALNTEATYYLAQRAYSRSRELDYFGDYHSSNLIGSYKDTALKTALNRFGIFLERIEDMDESLFNAIVSGPTPLSIGILMRDQSRKTIEGRMAIEASDRLNGQEYNGAGTFDFGTLGYLIVTSIGSEWIYNWIDEILIPTTKV